MLYVGLKTCQPLERSVKLITGPESDLRIRQRQFLESVNFGDRKGDMSVSLSLLTKTSLRQRESE